MGSRIACMSKKMVFNLDFFKKVKLWIELWCVIMEQIILFKLEYFLCIPLKTFLVHNSYLLLFYFYFKFYVYFFFFFFLLHILYVSIFEHNPFSLTVLLTCSIISIILFYTFSFFLTHDYFLSVFQSFTRWEMVFNLFIM